MRPLATIVEEEEDNEIPKLKKNLFWDFCWKIYVLEF